MFPFSVTQQRAAAQTRALFTQSGYELIAFDAEKLNVFAAQVRYCEPHWHPAPELITVLSGRFSVTAGNEELTLEQGDMLYINAEEVHSLSAEVEASQLVTVQFAPALFDTLHPAPLLEWCTHGRTLSASDCEVYHKLAAQLVNNDAPFQRIAAIYTLLDALVRADVTVSQPEGSLREAAMIKKGIAYINQQFDTPLTLSDVAPHAGMSYSWFSRLLKKVSRHNFKAYLTLVRVNKAKTLLCDTRTPITDISHSCGFQEYKYLIAAHCRAATCGFSVVDTDLRFHAGFKRMFHRAQFAHRIGNLQNIPVAAASGDDYRLVNRAVFQRIENGFQRQIIVGHHVGQLVEHHHIQRFVRQHTLRVRPYLKAGGRVALAVLRVPGKTGRHHLKFDAVRLQLITLTVWPGTFNKLNRAHLFTVADGTRRGAKGGGGFAFTVAGKNDNDAALVCCGRHAGIDPVFYPLLALLITFFTHCDIPGFRPG